MMHRLVFERSASFYERHQMALDDYAHTRSNRRTALLER